MQEPRVRVVLSGGLGNQMFMYAAGRAFAIRNRCTLTLDLQRFGRERIFRRRFLLDKFPIAGQALCPGLFTLGCDFADRLAVRSGLLAPQGCRGRLYETLSRDGTQIDKRLFSPLPRKGAVLDGYWQSEDYFADSREAIRVELTPPAHLPASLERDEHAILHADHSIAVGIRFYGEVPGRANNNATIIRRFGEAMRTIAGQAPGGTFFVFTDEPGQLGDPECLGVPFHLIGGKACDADAVGVMTLMSRCRSFVIGYSSFHWWAAWLGTHPDKTVFCLPDFGGNPHLYFPRTWIRVPEGG